MAKRGVEYNRHHLLFPANIHGHQPQLAALRNDTRLIVPIEVNHHRELHKDIQIVPPLSPWFALHSLRNFHDFANHNSHDWLANIDAYQKSVDRAMKNPKASKLERDLGELTIEAMQQQKFYVREGALHGKTTAII